MSTGAWSHDTRSDLLATTETDRRPPESGSRPPRHCRREMTARLETGSSVATRARCRSLLVATELLVAANAVGGAIWGLAGAEDVPREWLEGTPFDSYVVPSLVLLVAVGGGMTTAATAHLVNHPLAPEVSVAAGSTLMCWIVVQVLMIAPNGGVSWLQPAMFAAGGLVAALGWRLRSARAASGVRGPGAARGGSTLADDR